VQGATVAVVGLSGSDAVVGVLRRGGYHVVELASVDDVEVRGASAAVAVLVRWPVRHVGLGELGIPVVAWVEGTGVDGERDIAEAGQRGAFDVLRSSAPSAEVVSRLRAAERHARLAADLVELARTDELTGLSNRRHLDEHLQMVSSLARRQRTLFSLLMVDIDRTRRVNDEFGHSAGDRVVVEVARRLQSRLRAEDVAGRWAGEEFVVLLPHTDIDGAWRLADRIRATVCDEPIDLGGGRDVLVTVSIGCAEGYGDDLDDHVRRATAALDEAKAAGRNKAVADTSPVGP
jgi:two-component system cell cycle response regulator